MFCVSCGKYATKGSLRHPYCAECFTKEWKDNEDAFGNWLGRGHNTDNFPLIVNLLVLLIVPFFVFSMFIVTGVNLLTKWKI